MSLPTIDTPTLFSQTELDDPKKYLLDTTYRCDSCGAQAYIRATFKNASELFFCRHHGHKHYVAIRPLLAEWYTEEVRLDENRLIGSEN